MKRRTRSLLTRVASFVGATALTMGITASTALGAVTPPDMFGMVPNYANSPLPVINSNPVLSTIGNSLGGDRQYATDYPPIDVTTGLAPVFVVVPTAVLPAGTLTAISTWNQAAAGASPTPSAGDGTATNGSFYAYVLRPTGVTNQYSVVYQSGLLTVPALIADPTTGTINSQIETFTLPAPGVTVQAGDVIGFYGEGVPVDTGIGTDLLVYSTTATPVPAPAASTTITLGAGDYPIYPQARNYAIAATVDTGATTTTISGGMRKFVDSLPQLDVANNLGQKLPVAVPDTTTYPGSDYYEIEYGEYAEKMHSDLPATQLRGYRQVNTSPLPTFQYLGPIIVAQKDRPVRVKYINNLPTGAGGNLFIPTDTTYMGVGAGPDGTDYTQNRSTTHLHGGATPWISDGTPHQWTTPAGETASLKTGVSKADVPDMWFDASGNTIADCAGQLTCATAGATNDPGPGANTMYYTNQQSARLMFYHDHALGITRLNVYAGMAAGYLETDPTEQALIGAGTLPGLGIPLVLQEKTFVPPTTGTFTNLVGTFDSQLAAQDPTWDTSLWGGFGQLWFPHVYMPNQNPGDITGANAMGRWDYGPWFWPPFTGLQNGETANPYACGGALANPDPLICAAEPPTAPGTPDEIGLSPSGTPESFMDTPVINGTAYPYIEVDPTVTRFRILSVANDRMFNLSLFVAADKNSPTAAGTTGAVLCDGTAAVNAADCTEVKMVPFNSSQDTAKPFPTHWYTRIANGFTFDDRDGGVPDPDTRGPAMIQIGTEGGFLPAPVVIKNQPVNYVYNRRDIVVGNVNEKALLLGPAERADVVVDFSQFAGKTLILYNDAPAPVPAADPRLDYYTGDPDQTDTGGAPSTLPGYGPNTRTIMQIRVKGTATAGNTAQDWVDPTVLSNLQTALPAAFASSQEPIIVPQAAYNGVYGTTTTDAPGVNFSTIQGTSLTFTPLPPLSPNQTYPLALELQPKAIIEDFTVDYGRMNALLGVEIAHTNNTNQTSIIQAYIDPPTELVRLTDPAQTPAIGEAADGTQIWKITHNGVDTHAMHFHMFHVQVINRVGWDGAIRKPDPNELGWKDTVRMNPLEDVFVAMRPKTLDLPFSVPNSWRPLDPTQPIGVTTGFTGVDPAGLPVTVTNEVTNFGWEHVWHCHILGHEENDMMRALVVVAPPEAPSALVATATNGDAVLTWTDNSANETSITLQKAADAGFTSPTVIGLPPNTTTYTDTGAALAGSYYRVMASNTVGSTTPGYQQLTADSAWSNTAQVGLTPVAAVSPPSLVFGDQVVSTTSAAQTVTLSNTGLGALAITSIGATVGDFAETNTCGASLAAGAICTIGVTFTPATVAAIAGSLSIVTNDPVNPTLSVALSGNGVAPPVPVAGVTPTSLTFPDTNVGSTSAAQTVILSNTGTAPLTSTISLAGANPGDFVQANACGTVAAGANCMIGVSFSPTAAGARSANLSIATNDPVNPTLTVTLSGTGLAVPAGPVAPTNVSVNRTGNTAATLAWTDASTNETSFQPQVSTNGGGTWANLGAVINRNATQSAATGQRLTRNFGVNANTNASYRVLAINGNGSTASATVSLNNTVAPAAPGNVGVACNRVGTTNNARCTVTWTDSSNNNTGFRIQRANNAGFTGASTTTVGANAITYATGNISRNTTWYFRVQAYDNSGTPNSVYVNATPFPVPAPIN